jgi:uncharacterized membrane protein
MAHAEDKTTINRSAKEVFDFVLNGTNNPLWRPAVLDIQRISNLPDGVGARFKQGMKGPGGRIDADYEIVECKPNELIKFQVTAGPARPIGTYRFDAVGDSTALTFILDYQPKGLAKLMDPMITRQMQVEVATLANLKAYLESHR